MQYLPHSYHPVLREIRFIRTEIMGITVRPCFLKRKFLISKGKNLCSSKSF